MKREVVVSILLVVVVVMALTAKEMGAVNLSPGPFGDANSDGMTDIADAIIILQYEAEMKVRIDTRAADVNEDRSVNSLDAEEVLLYLFAPPEQEKTKAVRLGPTSHPYCTEAPMVGDINEDGAIDIADVVVLLEVLFPQTLPTPDLCLEQGDANFDGTVNIGDAVYILAHLFAGGPEPVQPQFEQWETPYDYNEAPNEPSWEYAYGVANEYDSSGNHIGYIIAGDYIRPYILDATNFVERDIYVVKTDLQGNVIWDRLYGDPFVNEQARGITRYVDDVDGAIKYAVVGNYGAEFVDPDMSVLVLKLAENGDLLSQAVHESVPPGSFPLFEKGQSIERSPDNGFIVGAGVNNDGWMLKLHDDLTFDWGEQTLFAFQDRFYDVRPHYNEAGFFEGYVGVTHSGTVTKVDTMGNFIWSQSGMCPSNSRGLREFVDDQGLMAGYICSGGERIYPTPTTTETIRSLTLLDLEGNQIWTELYSASSVAYPEGLLEAVRQSFDLHGNPDGFVAAGVSYDGSVGGFPSDSYLVKIDSEGEIVWEKAYSLFVYGFTDIQQAEDRGYAPIGATQQSPNNFAAVKTDYWGNS